MEEKLIHYNTIKNIWDKYCNNEEISIEDKRDYYLAKACFNGTKTNNKRIERKIDLALSKAENYNAFLIGATEYNPGYSNMLGTPTGHKH